MFYVTEPLHRRHTRAFYDFAAPAIETLVRARCEYIPHPTLNSLEQIDQVSVSAQKVAQIIPLIDVGDFSKLNGTVSPLLHH